MDLRQGVEMSNIPPPSDLGEEPNANNLVHPENRIAIWRRAEKFTGIGNSMSM